MAPTKRKRTLVTAALPYANGPIHIGHLVEYIQTDVYVRFLKLIGKDAIFCCADDTHGTPIQINAEKQGITPEELIAKYYEEHTRDFADFQIHFDSYYSTNSPENKKYSDYFFESAKKKGLIYTKEVELAYCETDKRFLPDRFVKGKCPKCGAEDQYGDVCEKCNSAYATIELVDPYCVLCKNTPARKKSVHYFFKLSSLSGMLEKWLKENKSLQDEVRNFVLNWIKEGLKDWDISRDGPYFGFKIPGEEDKYYYVWLDAPIGYIASTENYARENGLDAEKDYWKSEDAEIIHFIGKDIIYFHYLFWPALLHAADFNMPTSLFVHGFLTVNGEKMSKSRGTFLTARQFLEHYDAGFLRYYYASNLSKKLSDIDLNFKDFHERINNELVANIANLAYRALSMLNVSFQSQIGSGLDSDFIAGLRKNYDKIQDAYGNLDFREAVKLILNASSQGNKYMQDNAPWKMVKEDKEGAHKVLNSVANIVKDVSILVKPILPEFSRRLEEQLGLEGLEWGNLNDTLASCKISRAEIIIKKIDDEKLEVFGGEKMEDESPKQDEGITFSRLNVKVGQVMSVENHPNADKLLLLKIDLGTEQRRIVAGLRGHYTNDSLLGKKLCIVTNLERNKLRGVESEAMLLAGDDGEEVGVLFAEESEPGDQVYIDGAEPDDANNILSFKDFQQIEMRIVDGKPTCNGKVFKTDKEEIKVEKVKDGARVR
ncbi:methionine--tRNA ligase [Candidatus Woesearchaeota archaeon]|nr:methionine--tRNA ligase [Candidatus Woesearchaeota archaeon]